MQLLRRTPSVADWAYMSGIVDGEGSICVLPHGSKTYPNYRCFIVVVNTSNALMTWVARTFGGKVYTRRRKIGNYRTCYRWAVHTRDAAELARGILPFLVIKRKQAELLIEYTEMGSFIGYTVPDVVSMRRAEISKAIVELNNPPRLV